MAMLGNRPPPPDEPAKDVGMPLVPLGRMPFSHGSPIFEAAGRDSPRQTRQIPPWVDPFLEWFEWSISNLNHDAVQLRVTVASMHMNRDVHFLSCPLVEPTAWRLLSGLAMRHSQLIASYLCSAAALSFSSPPSSEDLKNKSESLRRLRDELLYLRTEGARHDLGYPVVAVIHHRYSALTKAWQSVPLGVRSVLDPDRDLAAVFEQI